MTDTIDRLIYMANQIAREFGNQRPREAVQATYDHIWHFWDPRMRSMIIERLADGGAGLSEVARAAIERLAASRSDPDPVTRATEFGGHGDSNMSDG